MAKLIKIDKKGDEPDYQFYCAGCKCYHGVWTTQSNGNKAIWEFNNDINNPTISPSIRVQHGQGIMCHSFVRNGKIEYLNDCTHELAGQTVEMIEE